MQGTHETADVYTRSVSGGNWTDSGNDWNCYLYPISPTTTILSERYMQSTHVAIGDPTPTISTGDQLVINSNTYYVVGVQMHRRPGKGDHHQEVFLRRSEI